jgi:hypothetical protein
MCACAVSVLSFLYVVVLRQVPFNCHLKTKTNLSRGLLILNVTKIEFTCQKIDQKRIDRQQLRATPSRWWG